MNNCHEESNGDDVPSVKEVSPSPSPLLPTDITRARYCFESVLYYCHIRYVCCPYHSPEKYCILSGTILLKQLINLKGRE